MRPKNAFVRSHQLLSFLKSKEYILRISQVSVGYTTAVQALDMSWFQFQAVLCMNQSMAVVFQLDVHLCKVAHDGDILGTCSQALVIQLSSFCVVR